MRRSLAESLDTEHHTIDQVSTSGALVQGVYQGCVRLADLKRHGDFGLGAFDGLDGEGIMVDGTCWQAHGDGSVRVAPDAALAPFWATTFFAADTTTTMSADSSWDDLTPQLDQLRPSDNLFCAIRIDGVFETIHYRVACKSAHGTDLVTATSHQAEFSKSRIRGSLVGFWTPTDARTINTAGTSWISGPMASCIKLHMDNHVHLAWPETPSFLAADLQGDPAKALATAKSRHN